MPQRETDDERLREILDELSDLHTVDRVVEYQNHAADYSAILTDEALSVQEVRVFYLKHMRDEWEWAFDNVNELAGFVAFKRREST